MPVDFDVEVFVADDLLGGLLVVSFKSDLDCFGTWAILGLSDMEDEWSSPWRPSTWVSLVASDGACSGFIRIMGVIGIVVA